MTIPPFDHFHFAGRCRALLDDIASGAVTVTPDRPVGYSGNESFTTSNGWKIDVFNDVGEWDYIDHFQDPDGRVLDFDEMWDHARDLADYAPTEEEQARLWGWHSR
jgi:hypothetical protein